MQLRVGFEMVYECPQPTPIIFNLNVHFTRVSDLVGRDDLIFDPPLPVGGVPRQLRQLVHAHRRAEGRTRVTANAIVRDSGLPDPVHPEARADRGAEPARGNAAVPARQPLLRDRPAVEIAWSLFGKAPTGWARVQAICDYVHRHIAFGYEHARMTRTALEAYTTRPACAATTRTSPSPCAAA
jgi:transglutaminase-like putative cysteine protease